MLRKYFSNFIEWFQSNSFGNNWSLFETHNWITITRLSPDRFAPICNQLRDGKPGKTHPLDCLQGHSHNTQRQEEFLPTHSSPTPSGTSHWPQVRQEKGLITSHGVKIASRSGHHHIFPRTCHSLWLPQSMSRDNNININILQFQLRVFQPSSFPLHHADFPRIVLLFGEKTTNGCFPSLPWKGRKSIMTCDLCSSRGVSSSQREFPRRFSVCRSWGNSRNDSYASARVWTWEETNFHVEHVLRIIA